MPEKYGLLGLAACKLLQAVCFLESTALSFSKLNYILRHKPKNKTKIFIPKFLENIL